MLLFVDFVHEFFCNLIAQSVNYDDSLFACRRSNVIFIEVLLTVNTRDAAKRCSAGIDALNPLQVEAVGELCIVLVEKQLGCMDGIRDAVRVYVEIVLERETVVCI